MTQLQHLARTKRCGELARSEGGLDRAEDGLRTTETEGCAGAQPTLVLRLQTAQTRSTVSSGSSKPLVGQKDLLQGATAGFEGPLHFCSQSPAPTLNPPESSLPD